MADDTCSVEDCDRPRAKGRRGYCHPHYKRVNRYGDPNAGRTFRSAPPPDGLCAIDGCDRPHLARGWCGAHYAKWERNGDPEAFQRIYGDDEARFWWHIEYAPNGCWLWTGTQSRLGYAVWHQGGRSSTTVHRWSYEHFVGPIPDDLEIDHVKKRGCEHRHCVNPEHLEAVTHAENVRRIRAD